MFAPNAPLRPVIANAAIQSPKILVPPELQHTANVVTKVSLNWAKLIARIYKVNPLLCTCDKEIKITNIVTDQAKIMSLSQSIVFEFIFKGNGVFKAKIPPDGGAVAPEWLETNRYP